ncbi:YdeI/OmpD-associated family protein [Streptococcus panodentis]|uniref:Bacteriocin n=1 Tax=Streptococcus panodentis TaxID=1581472 RepID=A0ABS5AUH7_9STRE|nr:YdeI/OmpD-associated family protein [Streptococcus panodentis]MBP2620227.1 bacteriocin [Streptococcus panodentis]
MTDFSAENINQALLELENKLDGEARTHFSSLPPSHKKEWLRYISEAKKDETKLRRLEKMKADLLRR